MTGNPKNISNRRTEMKPNKKTIKKIVKKKSVLQWSLLLPLQYMAGYILYSALPLLIQDAQFVQFIFPCVFHALIGIEMQLLEGSRKILKRNRLMYMLIGGIGALILLKRTGISHAEIWMTLYYLLGGLIDSGDFADGLDAPFRTVSKKAYRTDPAAIVVAITAVILFGIVSRYETAMTIAGYIALVFGAAVLAFHFATRKRKRPLKGGQK